ncbi:MAG: ion channel, partial [Actinomycetota bacterium]|nr:ion channel [Actinomycetota bacterium]
GAEGILRPMENRAQSKPTRFYDRFAMLFLLVTVTVGLLLLVDISPGASGWSEVLAVLVTVLTGMMLLLAVSASGARHRIVMVSRVVVALTVAVAILSALIGAESSTVGIVWVLLIVATPLLVLRRVLEHTEVTSETLFGAVSVYLLVAIAGTYVFLLTQVLSSNDFFGSEQPTTSFMYFSLVTISTLGYGDLAPAMEVPRAAAASLAVIGQIYLVVVVARLVSLYSGHRRAERTERSGGAGDEGD